MKKTRRLSIEWKRRQVTISVRQPADAPAGAEPDTQSAVAPPAGCPVCGCSSLLTLAVALDQYSGNHAELSQALAAGRIHLAIAGAAVWLCEQSFSELEGFSKEKEK